MRAGAFVGITNWERPDDNQYLDRLTAALSETGVDAAPMRLAPRAVMCARARGMHTLHVHWPEYLVIARARSRSDAVRNVVRLGRVVLGLVACRLLRVRVVWTVHNLRPHDPGASWAAFRAYDLLARGADVFVTHSHAAGVRTQARFPRARGRVVVAPLGHYLGAYPPARATPAEVRARYGVPESAFLLLAFGQVRPYKRLVELSRALAASDAGHVHMLVAGAAVDGELADELARISEGSERVHVDLRRIPNEQVSDLYGACDAAVINYAELFSSASLLLALSQGVAVVSARSEAASEVAEWPAISTYEDVEGLGEAVDRLAGVDAETRRAAALAAAEAATWERAALRLREAYATPA